MWTQAEMERRPRDDEGGEGGRCSWEWTIAVASTSRGWKKPGFSPRARGRIEAPRHSDLRSLASRHVGECVSVVCSQRPCQSSCRALPRPQPWPSLRGKALPLGVTLDSPQPGLPPPGRLGATTVNSFPLVSWKAPLQIISRKTKL